MIGRFSLYGFLKNQKYYEPFLLLVFLEKGLSFFQIGLLVAFRELAVTLMEVPSGALADSHGRRLCMAGSMAGYIVAFLVFGFSSSFFLLFLAMFFFAIGDAFRTGTHKAMIFKWLENNGRLSEKTKIYGVTRSWSKTGTALSSIIAAALVWRTGTFSTVFFFCIPPYLINLVNLLTYPGDLEGEDQGTKTLRDSIAIMKESVTEAVKFKPLRNLMVETMGFQGVHKVTGDYIQPVIKTMVISIPLLAGLQGDRGSAALAGGVYFVLAVLGIFGSRFSHRLVTLSGGERGSATVLWWVDLFCYAALVPMLYAGWYTGAVIVFVILELIQNLWRPMQVSRFDHVSPGNRRATVLSIESQAKSFSAMIYAPLLGLAVDTFGLWTLGISGAAVALIVITARNRRFRAIH
ncbi:MAG: MFS transporter [Candidatus Sabulitectum sp.]|nr:MFS transporter [Candidatus Sabulitectum sp.]